jgi:hypothetical protein
MDLQTQLAGLDQFLSTIYGPGTSLDSLLGSLGFEASQVNSLRIGHLPALADGLIEIVRKRLTWEDKDLWFRLLARRFSLDGEPPAAAVSATSTPLENVAHSLGIDLPYASHAEAEALERCRTRTALQDFKKELHRLALAELARSGEKPGKEQVVRKLERLADLRAAVDVSRMDYEAKRAGILKKVQAELDALELEFQPVLEAAEANAGALEAEIKNDVLLRGESLRAGVYQAVYMKGRVSWDSRGINDFARSHPEVLQFRKEGQPSVTLRVAGASSPSRSTAE